MRKIKYLFFDCMETLVDMDNLPETKDCALWSYYGSGVEKYWDDFDHFYKHYINARTALLEKEPDYEESSFFDRFFLICKMNQSIRKKI